MEKLVCTLFLFLTGFCFSLNGQDTIPAPMSPPRLVNDFAEIIPNYREDSLEHKLTTYNDTTSTQIAIVTVPSLGNWPVDELAFAIGDSWGVGQAGEDNGLVLLIAPNERKVFIATGRGIEGAITDVEASYLINGYLIPKFRTENYADGIDQATSTMIEMLSGEFDNNRIPRFDDDGNVKWITILVLIGVLVFIILINLIFGSSSGSGYVSSSGHSSTGSSYSSSSSSSYSSSSGSSFGGFGGGSFGGGGAGGSW